MATVFKPTEEGQAFLESIRREVRQKRGEYVPPVDVASANERKYAAVGNSWTDRSLETGIGRIESRYDDIESMRGKNGDCHSRKAVYRFRKFGDGRITKRTFLGRGFNENERKLGL